MLRGGPVLTHRPTLAELRREVLDVLDDLYPEWTTPTAVQRLLLSPGGPGGAWWFRVALVLERLAADGEVELQAHGRVRRFRREGGRAAPRARVHPPPRFDNDSSEATR